jgi:hypothetical protein
MVLGLIFGISMMCVIGFFGKYNKRLGHPFDEYFKKRK